MRLLAVVSLSVVVAASSLVGEGSSAVGTAPLPPQSIKIESEEGPGSAFAVYFFGSQSPDGTSGPPVHLLVDPPVPVLQAVRQMAKTLGMTFLIDGETILPCLTNATEPLFGLSEASSVVATGPSSPHFRNEFSSGSLSTEVRIEFVGTLVDFWKQMAREMGLTPAFVDLEETSLSNYLEVDYLGRRGSILDAVAQSSELAWEIESGQLAVRYANSGGDAPKGASLVSVDTTCKWALRKMGINFQGSLEQALERISNMAFPGHDLFLVVTEEGAEIRLAPS